MTTYSELAERLSRQKGKFDKLSKSSDPAERFTGERMNIGMEMKLDALFNMQELGKSLKGGKAKSYQDGGDPLNRFRNKGYSITPEVKSMWDQFQFESTPRTMVQPTFPSTPTSASYPIPEGTFQNFFKDSFNNQLIANKWNTSGYTRGTLPKDSPEDIMFNAKVRNKWNLDGRERWKAPTGSFSEVFSRAMGNAKNNPSTFTDPVVPTVTPSVPRGTDKSGGSGKGSTTTPATTSVERTNVTPITAKSLWASPDLPGVTGSRLPVTPGAPGSSGGTGKDVVGNLNEALGNIGPYLDNFANILNPIPRLNAPRYMRAPRLETSYNIDPYLQEARRGLRTTNTAIDRSVGQGNVAAAYKAGALADYFRGVGGATAMKENTERQLRNAQAQAVADVDNANAQITNNYQLQLTGRQEANRLRNIGMLNNLGEDFMTQRNDKAMRDLDKQKFAVLAEIFKDVIGSSPGLRNMPEFKKYGGRIKK